MILSAQSEVGHLRRLMLKTPAVAWIDEASVESQWRSLNYLAKPDFAAAVAEYDSFVALLLGLDIDIRYLPANAETGMDSLYVRDASIVSDAGVILCNMGKAQRNGEGGACHLSYQANKTAVLGTITAPGRIEGGDVTWLDQGTLAVGRGYRTNDAGISQIRALLPDEIELIVVPLPHWQGAADVFHLMSMMSPIDRDLLLVYSPLLPVSFRELLIDRGFTLIDVPEAEFHTMGCNVLAVGPRQCVMLEGNPITQARLEDAGANVLTYKGDEISRKGCGGPTCLTRPLLREV